MGKSKNKQTLLDTLQNNCMVLSLSITLSEPTEEELDVFSEIFCDQKLFPFSISVYLLCLSGMNEHAARDMVAKVARILCQVSSLCLLSAYTSMTSFTFEIGREVVELLRESSKLENLYLSFPSYEPEASVMLLSALSEKMTSSSLTLLSLSGSLGNSMTVASALGDMVEKNTILKSLYLRSHLGANSCLSVAKSLKRNSALADLALSGNDMTSCSYVLFNSLQTNSSLTSIDLALSGLEVKPHVSQMAEMLNVNSALKDLIAGGPAFDCEEIAHVLSKKHSLNSLVLNFTKIGAEQGLAIAIILKGNQSIRRLTLSIDFISVEGATLIAESFRFNHTLRQIYVPGASSVVGPNAAAAFSVGLRSNGSISSFPDICKEVDAVCERNGAAHRRAKKSVVTLLSLRQFRKTSLNAVPKEVVSIISCWLWKSRTDFGRWA